MFACEMTGIRKLQILCCFIKGEKVIGEKKAFKRIS